MVRPWLILTSACLVRASPNVFLPINAQVPPVARANQPFEFQFAQSTFTSSVGPISYILSNGPAWLRLDGEERTFTGTPTSSDVRSLVVDLVATDSSGSTTMPVTFVVSMNNGPGLGKSILGQLSTHTGFSSPDSLLLPHSTALSLSFSPDTFTNTKGNTSYYALCANSTPLPSWLGFDPRNLSFQGTAPSATSFAELPTTYTVAMIASDVVGFAGAVVTFSIVVESHLFAFGSSVQVINATAGSAIRYSGLLKSLALNGQPVNSSVISLASAAAPSWLSLDSKSLLLSGTPPDGIMPQNVTINATDVYGDTASMTVLIQMTSQNFTDELLGPAPILTAYDGSYFIYDLNKTLTNKSAIVNVHLGAASSWLTFDLRDLQLKGQAPNDSAPNDSAPKEYMVNITASLGSQSESQVLVIQVQTSQASGVATGQVGLPAGSPTGAYPEGQSSSAGSASNNGLLHDRRWIALPVVLPIAIFFTSLIIFCCWRRRRKRQSKYNFNNSSDSSEYQISLPLHREKKAGVKQAAIMSGALHSDNEIYSVRISRPPILDIPGVWKSYTNKRKSQFRASQASAPGGDRASRADSWHRYTMNFNVRPSSTAKGAAGGMHAVKPLQKRELLSRHRMKPEFPRFSVSSRSSPTHYFSRSRQTRSNRSFGSSAVLSSHMSGFGLGHGRSIPSQNSGGVLFGTRGVGHGDGRGPSGYGTVRDSWRNFRLMHLRSIDGGSSSGDEVVGCIVPTLRPVSSNPLEQVIARQIRSPSRHYKRSIDLHRRSTIHTLSTVESTTPHYRHHNRGPPSDPLQEFHRRRLLLRNSSRVLFTAGPSESSRKSSHYTSSLPRTPSKAKQGHQSSLSIFPSTPKSRTRDNRGYRYSHSESSSSSAISPLNSSPSKSSNALPRRLSHYRHNTYSTTAGIQLPLMGQDSSRKGSILSDDQDSRWESASSDAQSMDPYIYSREVNNGHRETSLSDTQQEHIGTGKGTASSIHGMDRFARRSKGLSWQRAERERDHSNEKDAEEEEEEERGRGRRRVRIGGEEKGKTFERNAGVAKGEPGNMSFRGDIRGPDDDRASAFV